MGLKSGIKFCKSPEQQDRVSNGHNVRSKDFMGIKRVENLLKNGRVNVSLVAYGLLVLDGPIHATNKTRLLMVV